MRNGSAGGPQAAAPPQPSPQQQQPPQVVGSTPAMQPMSGAPGAPAASMQPPVRACAPAAEGRSHFLPPPQACLPSGLPSGVPFCGSVCCPVHRCLSRSLRGLVCCGRRGAGLSWRSSFSASPPRRPAHSASPRIPLSPSLPPFLPSFRLRPPRCAWWVLVTWLHPTVRPLVKAVGEGDEGSFFRV
jgi:hypothetical protein